jgi:dipeptidyl aminopeptidase/acylaminoacyl peptidase
VEYFWMRPEGEGPWPALIFIHGHQMGARPGGKDIVDRGGLARVAATGAVAISVSQPGYGEPDGPPDYCGPETQNAVIAVVKEARRWPFVRADKLALYGVSRGAVVASMVEAREPGLAAVVLLSGFYDLETAYRRLKKAEMAQPETVGIAENLEREAGTTAEAFRSRSAAQRASSIKAPTLILNGADDPRIDAAEIEAFGRSIHAKTAIFPGTGHSIELAKRNVEIRPFLEEHLGIKY